eukprot:212668_1
MKLLLICVLLFIGVFVNGKTLPNKVYKTENQVWNRYHVNDAEKHDIYLIGTVIVLITMLIFNVSCFCCQSGSKDCYSKPKPKQTQQQSISEDSLSFSCSDDELQQYLNELV